MSTAHDYINHPEVRKALHTVKSQGRGKERKMNRESFLESHVQTMGLETVV